MKVLLLAALFAVAAAKPGLVQPGPAGPAPAPNPEDAFHPIAIGPAIIDNFEPVAIGPAIIDNFEPVAIGPAIVEKPVPAASPSPLVQIIVNVNAAAGEPGSAPVRPEPIPSLIPAEPVQVVEEAPKPEQVVEFEPIPSPIHPPIAVNPIGIVAPEAVEPVQIGVPVLPEAAVVLPEQLN